MLHAVSKIILFSILLFHPFHPVLKIGNFIDEVIIIANAMQLSSLPFDAGHENNVLKKQQQ